MQSVTLMAISDSQYKIPQTTSSDEKRGNSIKLYASTSTSGQIRGRRRLILPSMRTGPREWDETRSVGVLFTMNSSLEVSPYATSTPEAGLWKVVDTVMDLKE